MRMKLCIPVMGSILVLSSNSFAVVRYVDPSGTGIGGTTWATAHPTVHLAVSAASEGDIIKVAQGRYHPANQSTPIPLKKEVSIQGGYGGLAAGANADDHDSNFYVTILDGDINGDDDPGDPFTLDDNAHHVIQIPDGVQPPDPVSGPLEDFSNLDGFHIIGGRDSTYGGGIYAIDLDVISDPDPTEAVIRNCLLTENLAGEAGGAYYGQNVEVTFRNCRIVENDTNSFGCSGAGLAAIGGALRLLNCSVSYNYASCPSGHNGGGICIASGATMEMVCCTVNNNAGTEGGGISIGDSTAIIVNSKIVGNQAIEGGALYVQGDSIIELTNCTISDNVANEDGGGAIYVFGSSSDSVTIHNSILWNDIAGSSVEEIHVAAGNTPLVNYSDVQMTPPTVWAGTDNINTDPEFISPGTGDYRIGCASLCIDTGDPDAYLASGSGGFPEDVDDIDENDNDSEKIPTLQLLVRIVGSRIDMGAYELSNASLCSADTNDDCVVNVDDLLAVINGWGCTNDCEADVTSTSGPCALDSVVDVNDLLQVINQWGPCPASSCTDNSDVTLEEATDCMEEASNLYEDFSEDWHLFLEDCLKEHSDFF